MRPAARLFTVLVLAAATLALGGCIRSRAVVTSEPENATVYWRGVERGETPIEIPFIWYWYYDIRLEKEGYQPLEVEEYLGTPPWFLFPLDLFAELIPVPLRDTRELHYQLEPESEL